MPSNCTEYDVGQWVRQHTEIFLKSKTADGKDQLTSDRCTPPAMLALVTTLINLNAKASARLALIQSTPINDQKRSIELQITNLNTELKRYKRLCEENIDGTPQSVWFCVTSPLLLGWFGNATCTDVNPNQSQQLPPVVGKPLQILNQVACLAQANESVPQWAADYFYELTETLKEWREKAADVAGDVVAATKKHFWGPPYLILGALGLIGVGAYLFRR